MMPQKNRVLIGAILLCVIWIASAIMMIVSQTTGLLDEYYPCFAAFAVMAFPTDIFLFTLFFKLRKAEKVAESKISYDKDFDETEFDDWLKRFEPFVKAGATLNETPNKTFSKFGGLPVVPDGFVWPESNGVPIPFLLQLDLSEINPHGELPGFPTDGLMYVFVDNKKVNFEDEAPVDFGDPYKEGDTFKILFFEKSESLSPATRPDNLKTIYKEFHVTPSITQTYPDVEDCEEAFKIYCDRPSGGMDDEYDRLQWERVGNLMLGGWGAYIQGGGLKYRNERDNGNWILLLQLASRDDDENFIWGDDGNLYFFIRESDLAAKKFDNVFMDMQCT